MRRIAAALATLGMLAGCGAKEREPAAPIDSVQLNAIASSGPTVAEVLAHGNDATPKAQTAAAPFDYRGTWATNPTLCRRNAWRFAGKTVAVGGESRCTVAHETARTDGEVSLEVSCAPAGGAASIRTQERWSLVKRADGSMIVARSAGNGVPESATLSRCG